MAGKGMTVRRVVLIVAAALSLLPTAATHRFAAALDIELRFVDAAADNVELMAGMEQAAVAWESVLVDPVNVTIDVRIAPVTELGFAAGFATAEIDAYSYEHVRTALLRDAVSLDDRTAVDHLPPGPLLDFRGRTADGETVVNSGLDAINQYVLITDANAKALGIPLDTDPRVADGTIAWNEFFVTVFFDFDRTDGVQGNDFVSAAMHELGHTLGFFSGVDDADYFSLPNGPEGPTDLREFGVLNVLDLYRYSDLSLPLTDLAPGGDPFFSLDGGATRLAPFSTGEFHGDGDQASHWRAGIGLMSPSLPDDVATDISAIDLRALDVMGWDVDTALVPEPHFGTVCSVLLPIILRRFLPRLTNLET